MMQWLAADSVLVVVLSPVEMCGISRLLCVCCRMARPIGGSSLLDCFDTACMNVMQPSALPDGMCRSADNQLELVRCWAILCPNL